MHTLQQKCVHHQPDSNQSQLNQSQCLWISQGPVIRKTVNNPFRDINKDVQPSCNGEFPTHILNGQTLKSLFYCMGKPPASIISYQALQYDECRDDKP